MKRIASLPARLWAKLRSFRFTKKRIFALAAVCLAAALGFGVWRGFAPRGAVLPAAGELVRTTRLERQTLSESITVTGTVQSSGVTNVTTALTYPVQEILVQVGDTVREGDVICRLDSSDLEKELEQQQKQLAESKNAAQKSYNRALENYNSAVTAQAEAESAYHTASGALETARSTQYTSAEQSVRPYQEAYTAAQTAENDAGIAENNAAVVLNAAASALSNAKATYDAAAAALTSDSGNAELQAALDAAAAAQGAAQADYDTALNAHTAAKDAHTARTAERENAAQALQTAKQNCGYDALFQAYAQADEAFLRAKETYENAVKATDQAKDTLDSAADALKQASDRDDLEALYERIEDCTITAGANGTVTALNATVGSSAAGVNGEALAVLQNTDQLKVAVTIDEDDIKRVRVGQAALIRSDATGDAEIGGQLSQLSLTAGSSGGSGFGAEVTVTDTDSGLLIGLSAKVELILTQVENVYAVPYEALETDENGQTVVYARMPGEAEFSAVPVETGLETDYNVEIRGEGLADGMEVRVSTDEAAADGGLSMEGDFTMEGGQMFTADDGSVIVSAGPGGNAPMGGPGGGMPGGPGGM